MASSRRGMADKPSTIGSRVSRVLVVEDEADVAEMIRYNLGKEGYEVRLAATGTEALRQAKETRFDVILLDIMVPQLNGWEVCRRLKQEPETRGIPVIMCPSRGWRRFAALATDSRTRVNTLVTAPGHLLETWTRHHLAEWTRRDIK